MPLASPFQVSVVGQRSDGVVKVTHDELFFVETGANTFVGVPILVSLTMSLFDLPDVVSQLLYPFRHFDFCFVVEKCVFFLGVS